MLAAQVYLLATWEVLRRRVKEMAEDDRGTIYAEVLWATAGIVAAIGIATILYVKFKASAEAVPTNAPGISGSGGAPVTSPAGP